MSRELLSLEISEVNAESIRRLNTMEAGLQDKALYRAVRGAAKPVNDAMVASAPDDPATPGSSLALAVNILRLKDGQRIKLGRGVQSRAQLEPGVVAAVVGPNRGRVTIGDSKFNLRPLQQVALWAEHGTDPHRLGNRKFSLRIGGKFIKGPIEHPGARPKRWMQGSLDLSSSQIPAAFYASLKKFLEKA